MGVTVPNVVPVVRTIPVKAAPADSSLMAKNPYRFPWAWPLDRGKTPKEFKFPKTSVAVPMILSPPAGLVPAKSKEPDDRPDTDEEARNWGHEMVNW